MSMRLRIVLAAVSGVVGMLAFPPFGYWPLAIVSVAGFALVVDERSRKQAALLGAVFGAGLFGPMLHWTSVYVGAFPWLLLALAELGYLAAMGAIMPGLQRRRWGSVWTASAWVLEEAIRGRVPFGGFPWGRWAFSQSESPLKWFAALGGAPLVTFVVALLGALLASAIRPSPARSRSLMARAQPVILAGLIVGLGAGLAWPLKPTTSRSITVAAIQGDVPDRGLEFNARRRQVLDNHVAETLKLAAEIKAGTAPRPDFVLWPENASDIDPTDNPDAAQVIQEAADAVGVPILVGAILDGPGPTHVSNAGIVWNPSTSAQPGPGERYLKRHPVPFGEYIPLRSIAEKLSSKVNLVARDMVGGHGDGRLTIAGVPIGDVICFEVAYDSLVRSSVAHGAQLLVVQTNNATFGHTGETYQQLAMSQLRAVENGRTVVQVATSGKSAIISPSGTIEQESGKLFTADILERNLALSTETTPATWLGIWSEVFLAGLCVLVLLASIVRGARRPAGQTPQASSVTAREHEHSAAAFESAPFESAPFESAPFESAPVRRNRV
jgi:apolipoprotein N-acyltransferase